MKNFFINTCVCLVVIAVGLGAAEVLMRIKNSDQRNYNIEMWRYSKLLKKKSDDPQLGHEHRSNVEATLQGVKIRLNSFGMRQGEVDLADATRKRVMFLGSSMVLGWGVKEEQTMPAIIQQELKDSVQVFNTGIGNYNARRYVSLFDKKWKDLDPDVVIVHYFVRDAEDLAPGGGNFLLRHSQLAVTVYHVIQTFGAGNKDGIVGHYQKVYAQDGPGRQNMEKAMARLAELSRQKHFQVVLAMVPESHVFAAYPFQSIHEDMNKIAQQYGWTYVDFTNALRSVPAKDLWVMPGDPHYNALGHRLMAQTLLPYLKAILFSEK